MELPMINKTACVVSLAPLCASATSNGERQGRDGPAAGLKFNF
jgi:hypothetical protein